MRAFEWTAAAILALLGLRSIVYWVRRPLDSKAFRDQALWALWLTGRAGLWFAIAGIFAISASIHSTGRAFTDEFRNYRWYIFVPLGLAIIQLVTTLALGRSRSD